MALKETDEFVSRPETFIEGAGNSLKAAMDILRKYAAVPESLSRFRIETAIGLGNETAFFATAATPRAAAYFNLGKDLNQWRSWLATHGPVMVGLQVDATWDNATATQDNLDTFKPGTARGGHPFCVVANTQQNRFILRNSWSTTWGRRLCSRSRCCAARGPMA